MFPRAKLQRFNDVKSSTPSPADYNVVKDNIDGKCTISKSTRFSYSEQTLPEDYSFSNLSFHTPTTSKRILVSSSSAECSNEKKKRVAECNKDLIISNLTKEMEEVKQENLNLLNNNQLLHNQLIILKKDSAKYENHVSALNAAILEIYNKIMLLKKDQKEYRKKNQEELKAFCTILRNLKELHTQTVSKYNEDISIENKRNENLKSELTILVNRIEDLKINHLRSLNECSKKRDKLIEEKEKLETDMSETKCELEKTKTQLETANSYKQKLNFISNGLEMNVKSLRDELKSSFKQIATEKQNFTNYLLIQLEDLQKAKKHINLFLPKLKEQEPIIKPNVTQYTNDNFLNQYVKELEETVRKLEEQLEKSELNCKLLTKHKMDAEKETMEITTKYADLLGHQNPKQKIKHFLDLKSQYLKATKVNRQMEEQLTQQQLLIEKYKKEMEVLQKKLGQVPQGYAAKLEFF